MIRYKTIYFWQNMLSIHQAFLIRSLANSKKYQVKVIVDERVSSTRRKIGWCEPNYGQAEIIIKPNSKEIYKLCRKDDSVIHILSGISAYRVTFFAFIFIKLSRANFSIMSEPVKCCGVKGGFKFLFYKIESLFYRTQCDRIYAISSNAVDWFIKIGVCKKKIVEFSYFTDSDSVSADISNVSRNREFKIIYVGRLMAYKGVYDLIEALLLMSENEWRLDFVGEGEEEKKLSALISSYNLSDRVSLVGSVSNYKVLEYIVNSDVLVLPNKDVEGWGAVVNESLMLGTPVICTDKTGARCLIKNPLYGKVIQSGNIKELANALMEMLRQRNVNEVLRNTLKADYLSAINKDVVLNYFDKSLIEKEGFLTPEWHFHG